MSGPRAAFLVALLVLPVAVTGDALAANSAGNRSDVNLAGRGNSVAICQFTILINSVLILAIEDNLGLVASDVRRDLDFSRLVPPEGGAERSVRTTQAECSTVIRNMDIKVRGAPPFGTAQDITPGGVVLGPPPSSTSAFASARGGVGGNHAGNSADLDATGHGNSVAVCQFLILVNTVIVGGGAVGLSPGEAPTVHPLQGGEVNHSRAHCKTVLENVKLRIVAD